MSKLPMRVCPSSSPTPTPIPPKDTQYYVQVADTDKVQLLLDRANDFRSVQTLVICNTPLRGAYIADELQAKTLYDVSRLLDPANKADIDSTVDRFRRGNTQILVVLQAIVRDRGVIPKLADLVVNCDMPTSKLDYFHRFGVSGNASPSKYAIHFVTPANEWLFDKFFKADAKSEIRLLPEHVVFEA